MHYTLKKGTRLVVDRVEDWRDEDYYGVVSIVKIPGVNKRPFLFGYVALNKDCFEIEEYK